MKEIPRAEWAKGVLSLDKEGVLIERVLGVSWRLVTDEICFVVGALDKPLTKRGVLSTVSSIFNPDGFLAPILLQPKLLMRQLWQLNVDWDEPLPSTQAAVWREWLGSLPQIQNMSFPRCFRGHFFAHSRYRTELHIFCDASEAAFGVVAYIRFSTDTEVWCNFVVGKARCSPLQQITIPRLELQAAVLATRVNQMLTAELDVGVDEVLFWSDSRTALAYIKNSHRRFKVFVANRVTEIRENSTPQQWRFCPGSLNPADIASRGQQPSEFSVDSVWAKGPDFLWQQRPSWPEQPRDVVLDSELELRAKQVAAMSVTSVNTVLAKLTSRYSSYYKLKRIVARWLQIIDSLNSLRSSWGAATLSDDQLARAQVIIVKHVQSVKYADEVTRLQEKKPVRNNSALKSLCPFLDGEGVLRVGGRLKNSDLPEDTKYPIIVPNDCQVAASIIQDAHNLLLHSGVNTVIAEIRQNFWIPRVKTAVKMHAHRCIVCRKLLAKKAQQLMAELPTPRVVRSAPFATTGVDFFGPFYVRVRRTQEKRWGCIFTCLSTRALHLESCSSLDTDHFIMVLRRFQARRGNPKELVSDNGTNFVGAEREIRESLDQLNHDAVNVFLQQTGTRWRFNPPAASHFGGIWERMIRSVKRSLYAVLRHQVVAPEAFDTVLCDVEKILNARPLTSLSDDPSDLLPLTPNHLLLVRSSEADRPGVFTQADVLLRKKWRRAQALVDAFWTRFNKEYVVALQQRQKWTASHRDFAVGDLVLIADDNVTRGQWPMALVEAVTTSPDGHVRSATVRTSTATMRRPIAKLCLLEATV